jgi:hypothetical protein
MTKNTFKYWGHLSKEILKSKIKILNEKYKGNGISIHPWGVIVECFTKQKKS